MPGTVRFNKPRARRPPIQKACAKIGVSTGAATILFAMEHGLATWGKLPIACTEDRS